MMLKEAEDNLTLLQQIKENNMMVNMKAHNLKEDHKHQLENAQLRLFALVAKLDGLDADAYVETRDYVQRKVYVQKGVVDDFEFLA